MSKFMYVSECGDGVVVEAAVEGGRTRRGRRAGIARWHRRQPPRRPAPQASTTAQHAPLGPPARRVAGE